MNRIRGKNVIITGASSGIGRACAVAFAPYDVRLILVARRVDRLQAVKQALEEKLSAEVIVRALDVRDRGAVKMFADEFETLAITPDILINNAGLSAGLDKVYEGRFEDWDRMIDTNVKGLLNVSRYVLPMMVERNSGHVVNVGSIAGYQVYPRGNVYNATKYAVRALTEGMNADLLGTRIRVSSVSPGAVHTEFSQVRFHGNKERADEVYRGYTPLYAEDIAEAIVFVVNAPDHVNVQEIVIMPTAQRNVYCWDKSENPNTR